LHKSEKNARKKERNLFFNANNFENGVRIIRKKLSCKIKCDKG
jgi:hypothetical protein